MHKHWRIAALLLTAPLLLSAQSTFGTILGTVTDASGAVVPQAKIVITNQGENASRTVSTDSQGNFEALNLKAGNYTVMGEAGGFKTSKTTGLELTARQTLRVNIALELGQLTETVNVSGTAAVVTTDTATIASSLGTQQVLELPINYRGRGGKHQPAQRSGLPARCAER